MTEDAQNALDQFWLLISLHLTVQMPKINKSFCYLRNFQYVLTITNIYIYTYVLINILILV